MDERRWPAARYGPYMEYTCRQGWTEVAHEQQLSNEQDRNALVAFCMGNWEDAREVMHGEKPNANRNRSDSTGGASTGGLFRNRLGKSNRSHASMLDNTVSHHHYDKMSVAGSCAHRTGRYLRK